MLTDAQIKRLPAVEKTAKLFDGGGLYLEVDPRGGRYWRLKYRFGGKEKRLAFGVYPDVSLKEARIKREEAKALLGDGIDPGEARKAEKLALKAAATNSFESVAREWIETQRPKRTPRHAYYYYVEQRLARDIFPVIGAKAIGDIKPMELLAALRVIEERGNKELPGRIRATCAQIFDYGVVTCRCENNPAVSLRGALVAHPVRHQLAVTPPELPDLLRAIEGYDSLNGGDLQTKLALKLLALTFVRTSELREATWEEINLEASEWRIPAERMKMRAAHIVPLSRQAVEILLQLQAMNGRFRWVFAGRMPHAPCPRNHDLCPLPSGLPQPHDWPRLPGGGVHHPQ